MITNFAPYLAMCWQAAWDVVLFIIAHVSKREQDFLLYRLESLKGYLILKFLNCNKFPTWVLLMTKFPQLVFQGRLSKVYHLSGAYKQKARLNVFNHHLVSENDTSLSHSPTVAFDLQLPLNNVWFHLTNDWLWWLFSELWPPLGEISILKHWLIRILWSTQAGPSNFRARHLIGCYLRSCLLNIRLVVLYAVKYFRKLFKMPGPIPRNSDLFDLGQEAGTSYFYQLLRWL